MPVLFLFGITFCEGATYYVAKTGTDSNSCTQAQSTATPKLTINAGLACLSSGDTLQIRVGTYNQAIDNLNAGSNIPSGNGSFTSATRIMAYPGETVWLAPTGVNHVIEIANRSYVIVDGIKVDMSGTNPSNNASSVGVKLSSGSNRVRYTNGEIKNGGNGVQIADVGSDYNEILNTYLHDLNGPFSPPFTGFYVGETHNIIANNIVERVVGECIQLYSYNGNKGYNTVRNNTFRNCNTAYNGSGSGIIVGSGPSNLVYNNVVMNTQGIDFGAGISVGFGCSNCQIYNNTIYNNHWYGVVINSGTNSTVIKNNIIYLNGGGTILDQGTSTVQSNNVFANPVFVNASSGDFRIQSGSPAIGTGVDLSSIFTIDYAGTSRVLPWDAGAYKYSSQTTQTSSSPPPAAPANLRRVQ